ncbi:MAG: HypC/HybG/HupF family hydrogenase formation chaperone [Planctomycetes bacterium]|nr:HypC/HybG/HupF family hydrogenase formation chaperone [Planctomycetota bacterium]
MCLAVPGKIISIDPSRGFLMGRADFGGVVAEVCLEYLPEIQIGEYAIVHVGFAISRINESEALRTLAQFRELGILETDFAERNPSV